jgi:26S proteasome regulatory subunit T4
VREGLKNFKKDHDKSEDDLKALQSVGQIIGEVLKQLDEERCMYIVGYPSVSLHIVSCIFGQSL